MQNPSEKKDTKFKHLQLYKDTLLKLDRKDLKDILKADCPQVPSKTPLNEIFTAIENNSYTTGYIFPTRHWGRLTFINDLSPDEIKLLRNICRKIVEIPDEENAHEYITQFQNLIQDSRFTSSSIIPHFLFEEFRMALGENYEGELTSGINEANEVNLISHTDKSSDNEADNDGRDEGEFYSDSDEENDSRINITLLSFAVYASNKYIVKFLLNNYGWNFSDDEKSTSMIIIAYQLSYALETDNIEIAELLLTKGKANPLHYIEPDIEYVEDDKEDLSLLQIALLENPPIFKIMLQVFPQYIYKLKTPQGKHSITSLATLRLSFAMLNFLLESGYSSSRYLLSDDTKLNPLLALTENLKNINDEKKMLLAIRIIAHLLLLGDMHKFKDVTKKLEDFFILAKNKIANCLSEENLELANVVLDLIYLIANSAAYHYFPTEFKNFLSETANDLERKRNQTNHLDLKERCLSLVRFSAIFNNTPIPIATLPNEISQRIFKPVIFTWQVFIVQLFNTIHKSNKDNQKLIHMKMNHLLYNMEKNFPTECSKLFNELQEYSNVIKDSTEKSEENLKGLQL